MTTYVRCKPFSWMFILLFLTMLSESNTSDRIVFPTERDNNIYPSFNKVDGPENKIAQHDRCYTQEGVEGKCLPLKDCPELLDFISSRNGIHTPGTVNYLQNRTCKLLIRSVNVCCVFQIPATTTTTTTTTTKPVVHQPKGRSPLLPSMRQCGIITVAKITQGRKFRHGTHPWLVGVGYPKEDLSFKVKCGGSLITKRHVLTAAHCFIRKITKRLPKFTHVIIGEHSLSEETERVAPVVLRILEIKHPGYNATSHYNDIAILRLERDVDFSSILVALYSDYISLDGRFAHNLYNLTELQPALNYSMHFKFVYIRPACLPFGFEDKGIDLSQKLIVAGWGRTMYGVESGTEEPLEAELSVVRKSICKKAYRYFPQVPLDDTQICLGGKGRDACQGDSGGPLIYRDSKKFNRFFVMGIVSFGISCGSITYPGVYTYVPKYLDWINENV